MDIGISKSCGRTNIAAGPPAYLPSPGRTRKLSKALCISTFFQSPAVAFHHDRRGDQVDEFGELCGRRFWPEIPTTSIEIYRQELTMNAVGK
jgi:hypothetical protein